MQHELPLLFDAMVSKGEPQLDKIRRIGRHRTGEVVQLASPTG
jgi:hypothetical protein